MSYAVAKPAASDAGTSPSRPTTSIVYEFTCLFTHDLRKKQKRWQDGKLKYHAFNKRIMVYDERSHFVGDSHWSGDADLVDGDEVELDRGSAIVQVGECIGEREQDLTDVLDKRAREVEKRRQIAASRAGRGTAGSVPSSAASTLSRGPRQQHVPLSAMLQSPGPIGRAAIPSESPFEIRRQGLHSSVAPREQASVAKPPPSRKRKASASPPAKSGHAQNLFGVRLNLSAGPPPELLAARARALQERTNLQRQRMAEEREKESLFVESSPADAAPPITPSKPAVLQPSRGLLQSRPPPRVPIPQPTMIEIEDEESEVEEQQPAPAPIGNRAKTQSGFTDARSVVVGSDMPESADPPVRKKKKTKDTREAPVREEPAEVLEQRSVDPATEPVKRKKKSTKDDESSTDKTVTKTTKLKPKKVQPAPEQTERIDTSGLVGTGNNQRKKGKLKIPPTPEGPRAVLCIKPRKRRGLLMMAEPVRYPSPPLPLDEDDMPMRSPTPPPVPQSLQRQDTPMRSPIPPIPPPIPQTLRKEDTPNGSQTPPTPPPIELARKDTVPAELDSLMSDDDEPTANDTPNPTPPAPEVEELLPEPPVEPSPGPSPIRSVPSPARLPSSPVQPIFALSSSPQWAVPSSQIKDEAPVAEDTSVKPELPLASTRQAESPAESDSDVPPPLPKSRTRKILQKSPEQEPQSEKSPLPEVPSDSPGKPVRPQRRTRQRKQKTPEPTYSDDQSDVSVTDAEDSEEEKISSPPKGPRLTRMARKGIRSIEIIGYDDIPNPVLASMAAPPTISIGPRPVGGIGMPRVDRIIPKGNLPKPRIVVAETAMTNDGTSDAVKADTPVVTEEVKANSTEPSRTEMPKSLVSLETVPEMTPAFTTAASLSAIPVKHSSTAEDGMQLQDIPAVEEKEDIPLTVAPSAIEQPVAMLRLAVVPEPDPTTIPPENEVLPAPSKREEPQTRPFQRHTSFTRAPSLVRGASDSSTGSTKPGIVNPATRGKKAARKEDAAGHLPQCIVPFEPVQPIRRSMARPAAKPAILRSAPPRPANSFASATTTAATSAVTFSTASGGAWSRHAHDLLGIGRPGPP